MSVVAKAAMVVVDLDAERCISVDVITDDGTGLDPRKRVEALWESVKDDWPHCEVAFISNDAAHGLATQRRMWSFGMTEEAPDMAPRIEAHNAAVEARRTAA